MVRDSLPPTRRRIRPLPLVSRLLIRTLVFAGVAPRGQPLGKVHFIAPIQRITKGRLS